MDTHMGGATLRYRFLFFVGLAVFLSASLLGAQGYCSDEENCTVCHRYSGLGTIDKAGRERVFYINEEIFRRTVHASVRCTDCHTSIKEIPHTGSKRVDCATECHQKEPSTGKPFSHKPVFELYKGSVHGSNIQPGYETDKPNCVYCHQNPICKLDPNKVSGRDLAVLLRCRGCHVNRAWANRFFMHFTCRLERRFTGKQIVELCSSCHEDPEKMARYGLEPTWNLKDSFHWEAIKYGDPNAPNCITCHAPSLKGGKYDVHSIAKLSSKMSPLNTVEKKLKVCGQPKCHPGATPTFVRGKVHSAGLKFTILEETLLKKGAKAKLTKEQRELLIKKAKEEELSAKIVYFVQLAYTILIGVICGFMFIHQLLDLRITLRERREGKH